MNFPTKYLYSVDVDSKDWKSDPVAYWELIF